MATADASDRVKNKSFFTIQGLVSNATHSFPSLSFFPAIKMPFLSTFGFQAISTKQSQRRRKSNFHTIFHKTMIRKRLSGNSKRPSRPVPRRTTRSTWRLDGRRAGLSLQAGPAPHPLGPHQILSAATLLARVARHTRRAPRWPATLFCPKHRMDGRSG